MVAFDAALGTQSQNTSSTTIPITTTAAAASGSTIFVAAVYEDSVGGKAGTCSGGGLTWTTLSDDKSAGANDNVAWYSAPAPAGLASGSTITPTLSAAPSGGSGLAAGVSFLSVDPTPLERKSVAATTATAWTISPTVDAAGDLVLVASVVHNSVATTNTPSVGTEVVDFQNTGLPDAMAIQYVIATAAGATTVSGAWTAAGSGPIQSALAIKAQVAGQTVVPDADVTTTGWTTTPLFSKVNDASDATFVTATLV